MTIDKLGLIYIKDKKLLSVRSKNKDAYYVPGGKRKNNETDIQALAREIKEEISVDIIPESLKFINKFEAQAHGKEQDITVIITAYFGEFIGEIEPDSEIEEIKWLSYEDIKNATPTMKLILNYLKERDLIS
ncbi:MAG: NUDIX domain-containing protein [Candidatus Paceibacterota bacterium]